MTAHATLEERQNCLDAGMNDHVSKPIDPNALFDTVSRYFTSKPEPATATASPDSGGSQVAEIGVAC